MKAFVLKVILALLCLSQTLTSADNLTNFSLSACKEKSANDTPISVSVIGGNVTERNEFPWIINIRTSTKNYVGFCGGSLIDWNLVVTSAHCVTKKNTIRIKPVDVSSILVTAGGFDTSCFDGLEQYGHPESILIHPKYDQKSSLNDIALIKMKVKFNKTKAVRPIPIPSYNILEDAKTGMVAGWGSTETETFSKVLRKATLNIFKTNNCKLANDTTQFCAGGGGKDACNGDSGGPLMCKENQYFLCGIITSGENIHCGIYPGTYTNVYSYLDWIITNRDFTPSGSLSWWLYVIIISTAVFLMSTIGLFIWYLIRRRNRASETRLLDDEGE